MIVVNLLGTLALVTLSISTPLSYVTYKRRGGLNGGDEGLFIPDLINGKPPSINDIYWPRLSEEEGLKIVNNSIEEDSDRKKRIHTSLSVTNPLDVLRQRVLLEFARRKALQDQQQIDANRRFLNNIGKRSDKNNMDINKLLESTNDNELINNINNNNNNNANENRILWDKNYNWYNVDKYDQQDQLQKMETNDLHLL